MATTIGRVDFIVDLDGSKLPTQAKALGRQIAAAGKASGKSFGDGFDSEFEKSLNSVSANAAARLNKAGELAGEKFATSFDNAVKRKARGIQGSLADTLADNDKLKESLAGFEDLTEGVAHYQRELDQLNKTQVAGTRQLVLTKPEVKKYMVAVQEAAKAVGEERIEEEKRAKVLADLAENQEALNDEIYRMNSLSRDGDALRQAANKQGRDYVSVAADMRREMQGLNAEQQVSNRELTTFSDNLERTVESLKKQDDAAVKAANNKAAADQKRIDSDNKATQATNDRKAAAEALDKIEADIARRMGNLTVYKSYLAEVGNTKTANDELALSFENLRDLGGSERQIAGLENRLKSFNETLDKNGKTFSQWGKDVKSPLSGVTGAWRRMDGTVKLVVASILGAGDQVAVLGSALGAGLVALGGGLTSLVVGATAGIGVVVSLFQKIEEAPAAMRPTIASFQALGDAFGDVNERLSQDAFDEIGDSFVDLNRVIRSLEPALEGVYKVIGKTVRGFADFAESKQGFKLLEDTIKNAEGNLEIFIGSVGTFGAALLRAFDRAQPLVEDMFVWIDRLANQFDDFTQSGAFTTWIENAQAVWKSFGGTLDAVSLALHNLVTPEAVQRTTDLLDNLTRMAPGLGELLNTIGTLDPFGLLVDIFADLAEAFENVAPAATAMAEGLNGVIKSVPAPVWVVLADAIGLFVTAFLSIKAAAFVSGMLSTVGAGLTKLGGKFGIATTKAKGFAGVIGKLGGVKGLGIAIAIGSATAAFDVFTKSLEEGLPAMEDIADAAHGGASALELLRAASERSDTEKFFWQDYNDSLKDLPKLLKAADTAAAGFGGETLNLTINQQGAIDSLKRLGEGLSTLSTYDMPGAQSAFQSIVKEFNLSDREAANLLKRMGPLGASFREAAGGADGAATKQEALNFALGKSEPAAEGTTEALIGLAGGMEGAAQSAKLQSDAMERLTGKSVDALNAIEGVADGIKSMGSATRENRSAARDYEAAIDDLTASIEDNGSTLDITSEAGRANQAALDDLASSTLDLAGETYNLTGSQEAAAAAIQTGRDALIAQLGQFGITGAEAEAYADQLGLIPGDVETVISANTEAGMEMADAFAHRLFELGLIETDPLVTLQAEQAKEEARILAEQLAALDTTVYTTQLDANGDPVGAVLESTATQMFAFSNKVSTTTLDANGDPMYAVLDDTANKLMDFEKKNVVTTLDANGDPMYAVLEDTANKLNDFASTEFTTTLDANGDPAGAVLEKTASSMTSLQEQTFMPKIDADNKKATEKTKTTMDSLLRLDGTIYKPVLDVNNKSAITNTTAVQTALDNVKSKTVTITVNTNYPNGRPPATASGGLFGFSQLRQIAEAGPEAVVPLRRPLSQVDPAVRALSAFAQGITMPGGGGFSQLNGGGGNGGGGSSKVVNVASGAIVIQGDRAPEATATNVVNRLAQRIAG